MTQASGGDHVPLALVTTQAADSDGAEPAVGPPGVEPGVRVVVRR